MNYSPEGISGMPTGQNSIVRKCETVLCLIGLSTMSINHIFKHACVLIIMYF